MSDYLPKYVPAVAISLTASTDVTGGRVLVVTGEQTVGHADADASLVAGVASRNVKTGDRVGVYPVGGVHRLIADGAIAAGDAVATAAEGKISATGENKIGVALSDAADGDVIDVLTN